ncbi:MAG: HK97 gp10 family phage protein [Parvibaculaceae bacterium]|nr:HK97 gp10 family phage protein [Parvibaculaceae bacterium]
MKITGALEHEARLKRLASAKARAEVTKALFVGGAEIELEAEHSITNGSISGSGHVASAPGQPPNADTRLLDMSIDTTVQGQTPPRVNVTSNAPYSAHLEFGTSKMAERPFMRPAAKKKRSAVTKRIADAIDRVNRG